MPDATSTPEGPSTTLQNADWSALRLLNNYRLFLLVAFAAVFYLSDSETVLGQRDPLLFKYTHLLYLLLALISGTAIALRKPDMEVQFYLQSYLDILCLATLMYASGGISSGLGILLVVQLAVIGHCAKGRYAALFAAMTTSILLSQELYARSVYGAEEANLTQTALVCVILFFVSFLTSVVLPEHLDGQSARARPLSVKEIADLNSQIIAVLESGLLFVDTRDKVQLANETALDLLDAPRANLPVALHLLSQPLADALHEWQEKPTSGNRPFSSESNHLELLPGFAHLGTHGTLIKLEDHRVIKQQVQQLKLASLGRLSASIAHEIRNPLGAISNAVQLLGESDQLSRSDSRLIDIAESHTQRINRIIEDVMLLSRRQSAKTEMVDLAAQLQAFKTQFILQNSLHEDALTLPVSAPGYVWFDPLHLDQILWNLCSNSIVHNPADEARISISCSHLYAGSVFIEIADNGPGISAADQLNIFEPFYTTEPSGTGLGLFIIQELCELNHASIEYVPQQEGACFRIKLPVAQDMAA